MCRSRRELSNEYLLAKIGVDDDDDDKKKSASIQPRTSPSKFGVKYSILFTGVLTDLSSEYRYMLVRYTGTEYTDIPVRAFLGPVRDFRTCVPVSYRCRTATGKSIIPDASTH